MPPGDASIAPRTWRLIAGHPYEYTSGDVIFTVHADRQGISQRGRPAARKEFFRKPRASLRSSDLGRRYGWGIHADPNGRLAVYGRESPDYSELAAGSGPRGRKVKVLKAMRRTRA
jgi:hypothetical protein